MLLLASVAQNASLTVLFFFFLWSPLGSEAVWVSRIGSQFEALSYFGALLISGKASGGECIVFSYSHHLAHFCIGCFTDIVGSDRASPTRRIASSCNPTTRFFIHCLSHLCRVHLSLDVLFRLNPA